MNDIVQGVVIKLLVAGMSRKSMTKNNYWELDDDIDEMHQGHSLSLPRAPQAPGLTAL